MNTMKVISEAVDYGDAPEIFVTGYSTVTRISAGVIRETFYAEHLSSDGTMEKRVALHLLWDAQQWIAAHRAEMMTAVSRLTPTQPTAENAQLH
jgi:hypothetical protein